MISRVVFSKSKLIIIDNALRRKEVLLPVKTNFFKNFAKYWQCTDWSIIPNICASPFLNMGVILPVLNFFGNTPFCINSLKHFVSFGT